MRKFSSQEIASHYELLLSKRMKESLLDDCPGMTEPRKKLLLKKYGNIAKMKKASLDELLSISGIGPVTGQRIFNFLQDQ